MSESSSPQIISRLKNYTNHIMGSSAESSMDGVLRMFSLAGKTAVVTGGTRGIGQAMAIGLADAGADIILIQVGNDFFIFTMRIRLLT